MAKSKIKFETHDECHVFLEQEYVPDALRMMTAAGFHPQFKHLPEVDLGCIVVDVKDEERVQTFLHETYQFRTLVTKLRQSGTRRNDD